MHGYAPTFVLLSAILHATWNAQLKGSSNRSQFMASMSTSMGTLALICLPFVPFPVGSAWACIALSAVLHAAYNLFLLHNYRICDFSSAYPIARGISAATTSCAKSRAHSWLAAVRRTCGEPLRTQCLRFFRFRQRPASRYTRYSRLWFTCSPSRASSTCSRR
jgi:hypothetical protein